MRYPRWFPYPTCWLKAIGLLPYLAFCWQVTLFWGVIGTGVSLNVMPLFLGLICPFVLIACLHNVLFFKEDSRLKWLPKWASWRTAINAAIVFTIALLFSSVLILPFAVETGPYRFHDETLAQWFVWLFITSAAYLYHYDGLARQRRNRRQMKAKSPI